LSLLQKHKAIMTTIFKDIEQLRNFITIDISSDLDVVLPYLKQAEKYVKNICGDELFALASEYVNQIVEENQEPEVDETLDLLLPYLQLPLANFGYLLAIDKLNVNVGNTGITVTVSNNLEPASSWRIDRLKENLTAAGYDALEDLIKFLEKNKEQYPDWQTSEAYSYNKQFFINNADEFYKSIHKQITRIEFLNLKEFIALAEIEVLGIVGNELFEILKAEVLSGEISEVNLKLMRFIKPAVCFLSLTKQKENQLYSFESSRLLENLKIYLDKNALDFPEYLNSTCYSTSKPDYNSDESGLFTFGL